jgi:DNA polymerase III subunit delta'
MLRGVRENRLSHALLLKGRNLAALKHAAHEVAAVLLGCTPAQVISHPDLFLLQARNRMRQISVDHTRELMRNIQHSPSAGVRKVALVMEVDRMNQESANAFLKTLEEPPLNTNIILTTVRPNALLDTIVSRCLAFWFHEEAQSIDDEVWVSWKQQFREWMGMLSEPTSRKQDIPERLMRLYGLLEGFHHALDALAKERWDQEKALLPEQTPDEELDAMEVGASRAVRIQLLTELEQAIRDFALEQLGRQERLGADEASQRLEESISELEYLKGLLDVNLAESKMLEVFFLKLLRIWAVRAG